MYRIYSIFISILYYEVFQEVLSFSMEFCTNYSYSSLKGLKKYRHLHNKTMLKW